MRGHLHMNRLAIGVAVLGLSMSLASPARPQAYVGLTGGATVATMIGGLIDRADVAYGAVVGLNLELEPWSRWLIDMEFLFIQKGVSNVPDGADEVDFRHTYLETPVTLNRLLPIANSGWSVSPYLGVTAGLNRGCDIRSQGEFEYADCEDDTLGGTASRLEVSVPVGVALRRSHPGGSRLAFEIRFSQGLTRVLDATGGSARNSVFACFFSFALPLGRGDR